jgi:hypothetical protein
VAVHRKIFPPLQVEAGFIKSDMGKTPHSARTVLVLIFRHERTTTRPKPTVSRGTTAAELEPNGNQNQLGGRISQNN